MKKGIFMPGRLESKRLPNKLILPIGKTNLWEIACKKLSKVSDDFEKVVLVSKEDEILAKIAKKYKLKIIYRDPETTKIDNPIHQVFKDIKQMESDIIMFLNPCLLFLRKESIEYAFNCVTSERPFLESVKRFNSWLYDANGRLITDLDRKSMNTKFIEEYYEPAHAFRIFDKNIFFETGQMSSDIPQLYELSSEDCTDVDTKEDFEFARWKYENKKQ